MKDRYDRAVEILKSYRQQEFKEVIRMADYSPYTVEGGCLFRCVSPTGKLVEPEDGMPKCGDLLEISWGKYAAYCAPGRVDSVLTEKIQDSKIPFTSDSIKKQHLDLLVKFNRYIDKRYGRPQPCLSSVLPLAKRVKLVRRAVKSGRDLHSVAQRYGFHYYDCHLIAEGKKHRSLA